MELPIFFINLDRDTQRRELLQQQFKALSLQGNRLEAIWWTSLTEEEQERSYSPELNARQYYQPLVNGEKGCYASHIKAWQQLLESEAPAMVVLEDDVQLLSGFGEAVQAIAQLEQAWDMIKLMGRPGREKISARQPLFNGHDLIRYRRVPSFTAAYVISRTGAEKMLRTRVPFGRPIDIDLRFWWENGMRIEGVYPPVVALDESSQITSITGREVRPSWLTRWRKLRMKIALTWGNARHS